MSSNNDGYLTKTIVKKPTKKNKNRFNEDAETSRHSRISFKKYLQDLELELNEQDLKDPFNDPIDDLR
jgi:hypothetical protein